jgi:hypothetical protein
MTQTHLTSWTEAAEARRACEGALFERMAPNRGSIGRLHAAFATMQSTIRALAAYRPRGTVCDPARSASDEIVHYRSVLLD